MYHDVLMHDYTGQKLCKNNLVESTYQKLSTIVCPFRKMSKIYTYLGMEIPYLWWLWHQENMLGPNPSLDPKDMLAANTHIPSICN